MDCRAERVVTLPLNLVEVKAYPRPLAQENIWFCHPVSSLIQPLGTGLSNLGSNPSQARTTLEVGLKASGRRAWNEFTVDGTSTLKTEH
jgi:hypothetical protein